MEKGLASSSHTPEGRAGYCGIVSWVQAGQTGSQVRKWDSSGSRGECFLIISVSLKSQNFKQRIKKKNPTLIRYKNKIKNYIPHTIELVFLVIFRHLFLHYLGPFGICSSDCFLNRGLVSLWPGPPVDKLHFRSPLSCKDKATWVQPDFFV